MKTGTRSATNVRRLSAASLAWPRAGKRGSQDRRAAHRRWTRRQFIRKRRWAAECTGRARCDSIRYAEFYVVRNPGEWTLLSVRRQVVSRHRQDGSEPATTEAAGSPVRSAVHLAHFPGNVSQ